MLEYFGSNQSNKKYAIIFGVLNAFVPIVFALFITDLSAVSWFPALGGIVLMAVTFTFLGLFIAVSVSEVFEAQTFSNFFRFPMVFLCGLFIPVQDLPLFIRPISYILPLTYGADILKTSMTASGYMQPWVNFWVLLGFSLFLFAFSTKNVKKKWIY